MAGKREENPARSSNNLRGDVLRMLGVLKVATVEQIQQISAPHLSYRHTDKPTPSKRKQAPTASHTGALSDLRKHGLFETGGSTETGESLRHLTLKGLEAASYPSRGPHALNTPTSDLAMVDTVQARRWHGLHGGGPREGGLGGRNQSCPAWPNACHEPP
ncbi:hypothetical protein [Streptomyces sp. B1I3]|uniref:hypothetical protein n=1 Tax=Streptomyces sp. B1I3 TaxID=3042264 RepID=UPI00277D9ECE|nr:hypothetical protein [Streptomyces sp. B1I3]MDQ0798165.1 hypothetical protein [Streptomyces sp. B1I3]